MDGLGELLAPTFAFLGGVLAALVSRMPALTADGRRVIRIRNDLEVIDAMPKSAAKDALARDVRIEVAVLLRMRRRARSFKGTFALAAVMLPGMIAIGYVAVRFTAFPDSNPWVTLLISMLSLLFTLAIVRIVLSGGFIREREVRELVTQDHDMAEEHQRREVEFREALREAKRHDARARVMEELADDADS